MRWFLIRLNFSCTLIRNLPQLRTGHMEKQYTQAQDDSTKRQNKQGIPSPSKSIFRYFYNIAAGFIVFLQKRHQ